MTLFYAWKHSSIRDWFHIIKLGQYWEDDYDPCRRSHGICSIKNGVLKNFRKFKSVSESLFEFRCRPESGNFIKKEILAQVFSSEFCEIFKNTCFTEHLRETASSQYQILDFLLQIDKTWRSVNLTYWNGKATNFINNISHYIRPGSFPMVGKLIFS